MLCQMRMGPTPRSLVLVACWATVHALVVPVLRQPPEAALVQPSCAIQIRKTTPEELVHVAQLQLDVFVPMPEPPPDLVTCLASLYEANMIENRKSMRARLLAELNRRLSKGATILVAIEAPGASESQTATAEGSTSRDVEGPQLASNIVGTIDISSHEIALKTHAVSDGLYVSHMAVAPLARRRGIARDLLRTVSEAAQAQGRDRLYLHVEPHNVAAVELYKSDGYLRQPDVPLFTDFTRALNLQDRAVLYAKSLLPT